MGGLFLDVEIDVRTSTVQGDEDGLNCGQTILFYTFFSKTKRNL
jgi:hypothetical protein